MFKLERLLRPNIRELVPYSSARGLYTGREAILLDANENPYGELNRYPDPVQSELKSALAELSGLPPANIFAGNGSDEVIDLMFRIFCSPGKDCALTVSPTYGMYEFSASVNGVSLVTVPLTEDFSLDRQAIINMINRENPRLLIFCSPNNPTGNILNREVLREIISGFEGVVLIDEAYIDFSSEPSWVSSLRNFPNLVIARTLSKAYGMAAARVGLALASEEIISVMTRVKPPYNVSSLNQQAALRLLGDRKLFRKNIEMILEGRRVLEAELPSIKAVTRIYPSQANFLLVEFSDAGRAFSWLAEQGIITRNRSSQVPNTLRITVGTPAENSKLIKALKMMK